MSFIILAGSYSNDVYTLYFDSKNKTLSVKRSLNVGFHPSWITPHPKDKSTVFAGLEQEDGRIIVIKYTTSDWTGSVVADSSSGGRDPCFITVVKDELLIANVYSSGSISVLPISKDAPFILAEAPIATITLAGSGPNKERQQSSHTHQVFYSEKTDEILVPDLGGDRVYRLRKENGIKWKIDGHIDNEAGGGPRHVAIHDGYLYTLLELTSCVAKHSFPDPSTGVTKLIGKVPTMLNPPPEPNNMLAAEILIPKPNMAYPVPYMYVSNRNQPSLEGDSITIFSIAKAGAPELVAEVRTRLNHLRGMELGGPDDRYLVAGGVNGGGVKVFERTEGGRNLKLVAEDTTVQAPTSFLWV
ncbi:hypothetical protein D9757_004699 [Collybiopsis confluens]|uniref:Isomerase YbhE n=1 Tax=Collybiopsis confluens TaxID=2823264 RepID=A0A8H5HS52_9AGAR|nr:hypothetical protein D9757_004699 [Collybiopsis confluens]